MIYRTVEWLLVAAAVAIAGTLVGQAVGGQAATLFDTINNLLEAVQ